MLDCGNVKRKDDGGWRDRIYSMLEFGSVDFLQVTLLVFGLLWCQRRILGVLMYGCRATQESRDDS